jgi:exo-beta-1,3-glucanase (GH17 family)
MMSEKGFEYHFKNGFMDYWKYSANRDVKRSFARFGKHSFISVGCLILPRVII